MPKEKLLRGTAAAAAAAGYLVMGAALLSAPASAAASGPSDQPTTVSSVLSNVTPDGCNPVNRNYCCQEW